jgi:hypothetical protein
MDGDNPFTRAAEAAAERTNHALAGEITNLTIASDVLKKMVPAPADQEKLRSLLEAVNSARTKNEKIAALENNLYTASGALVQLLSAVRLA